MERVSSFAVISEVEADQDGSNGTVAAPALQVPPAVVLLLINAITALQVAFVDFFSQVQHAMQQPAETYEQVKEGGEIKTIEAAADVPKVAERPTAHHGPDVGAEFRKAIFEAPQIPDREWALLAQFQMLV